MDSGASLEKNHQIDYEESDKRKQNVASGGSTDPSQSSCPELNQSQTYPTLLQCTDKITRFVNKNEVGHMIDIQTTAISKLQRTNTSLAECSAIASDKLISTTKLFKKTAKHISDSKRDLDVIFKKLLDLKSKIRAERPDLFAAQQAAQLIANDTEEELVHSLSSVSVKPDDIDGATRSKDIPNRS